MARDANGNYTLPAGNPVAAGTVISTTWANPTLTDIAQALTDSLSRNGDGGMLVAFENVDGNVALPGITWTLEPSTGLYREANNDMQAGVAGSRVTRWFNDTATPNGEQNPFQIWDGLVWRDALRDNHFGPINFQGDVTVGGTLGVTGAATFSGKLLVGTTASIGTTSVGKVQILGGESYITTNNEVAGYVGLNSNADNSLALMADPDNLRAGSHIAFYVDGIVERIRLDASGNLLVGTTTAYTGGKLSVNGGIVQPSGNQNVIGVYGTSGLQMIGVTGGDNVIGTMGAAEPLVLRTGSTERLRIDASGNVGIGTSSPNSYAGQTTLNINSAGVARLDLDVGDTMQGFLLAESGYTGLFTPSGSNFLMFGTNNTERMRIDSSGNVGIGTSSPTNFLGGKVTEITNSSNVTSIVDNQDLIVKSVNRFCAISVIAKNTAGSQLNFGDSDDREVGGFQYDHTNNYLVTRVNGAERMRIDASGNMGLGAVPSAWGSNYLGLDVGSAGSFWGTRSGNTLVAMSDNSYLNGSSYIARNTGVGSKYYQNAGAHYWDTAASASAGAVQTNSTLMQLTASGDIYLGNTTSWSINGTLGNLVTGPHYTRLPTANGLYWSSSVNTSNQYIIQNQSGTGVYVAYGSTSWSSTSDERLKDIIEPITDGLEKVATLRTVIGKYKTDEEEVRRPFLMAQDVFEVLPEAVDQSDPDAWGLSTHDLTPLLVSALKDAKNLIEALTARIEALEGA